MTVSLVLRCVANFSMRVLLTGASGYIGAYLLRHLPRDVRLTLGRHSTLPEQQNPDLKMIHLDLNLPIASQLKKLKFDCVIHAAAMANLQTCENNPDKCMRINYQASLELAEYCQATDSAFVFLSTDIIFSGKHAPYAAADVAHPLNTYGLSKKMAEDAIRKGCSKAAILRLALVLGRGLNGTINFLDWFSGRLSRFEKVPLFKDEIRTPLWADDVAQTIWIVAAGKINGTHHLCGDRVFNRYELGRFLAEELSADPDLLYADTYKSARLKRPANVSMLAGDVIPAFSFDAGIKKYFKGSAHE